MTSVHREHLLGERTFLLRELAETPDTARLTRTSLKARLQQVESELGMPTNDAAPTTQSQLTGDQ